MPPSDINNQAPVVIAIVGYRNHDDMHRCLSALTRQSERNFVVSICENGGAAAFAALMESLRGLVDFTNDALPLHDKRVGQAHRGTLRPHGQPVRVYGANDNLGYAGGINVSLAQLERDQQWSGMWILNPDTEPHPDALAALIARARTTQGGIIGSRLVFKATQRIQVYGGGNWRWLIANGRNIGLNEPCDATPDVDVIETEMNYVSGASLFATRDYIERVGPLDERYFLYCEEVDWCFRRGKDRLRYAHDSIVYHAHGTTMGSNANRKARSPLSVYLDERNRLLVTRRFFPVRYPVVVVAALLFTLKYVKAGATRNFFVALSGWLAGLRGEEGLPKRFAKPETATRWR